MYNLIASPEDTCYLLTVLSEVFQSVVTAAITVTSGEAENGETVPLLGPTFADRQSCLVIERSVSSRSMEAWRTVLASPQQV